MNDEHEFDLAWHALNYRTAGTRDAERCWCELVECVNRLILRGETIDPYSEDSE